MKRISFLITVLFSAILAIAIGGVFDFNVAGVALLFSGIAITALSLPSEKSIAGMNSTNNLSARETYQHARRMLYNAMRNKFSEGFQGDKDCTDWVDGRKLSQNEIRLEVRLNITSNSFIFGLTPNQANSSNLQFPTERRLELQDTLVSSEYGVFVANPSSDTDVAFELKTYGNNQVFTQPQADQLNSTFYSNGFYQLKCNNDVVAPYRGLWNHMYVPETQATAAPGAASPIDQRRGAEDGFITQEPNILLIGAKNYVPSVELKAALTSAGTFARAIVIYRGILAQNSTIVN